MDFRTCVLVLILSFLGCVQCKILAGVTIESYPFVKIDDNRFSGLCVDLMNEIQLRTGLNYSLYLVKDNKYGPGNLASGRISGLIGDVHSGKADFAIADMTVLAGREKYVNFTRPFFTFSISALVQKKHVKNLKTIDDLALKSNMSVGVYSHGNILLSMSKKKDVRNIRWLYERILKNESNLFHDWKEAIRRVQTEEFAYLQEEPRNAFIAQQDCNLTTLHDPQFYFYAQYAIAVRSQSPYLIPFNAALEKLEKEGFLTHLKAKYFLDDKCTKSSTTSTMLHSPDKTAIVTILLFLTMYLREFLIK